MNKTVSTALLALIVSTAMLVRGTNVSLHASLTQPVHNINTHLNYTTIQAAIDAPETLDGHTLMCDAGNYTENVKVYKSLKIVGAGTSVCWIIPFEPDDGIYDNATNVTISGFTIKSVSGYSAVRLNGVSHCNISDNLITGEDFGIALRGSNDNSVCGNTILGTSVGILVNESSDNTIYHNNLMNIITPLNALRLDWSLNVWDKGYPTGGNYWGDYSGVDVKSGPDQNLLGSDGIGDTPYYIISICPWEPLVIPWPPDEDRYPLMSPWPQNPNASFIWSPQMPRAAETMTFDASTSTPNRGTIVSYIWDFGDGNITTTTNSIITHRYANPKRYNATLTVLNSVNLTGSITRTVKITGLADINVDGKVDIRDLAMVCGAFGSYPSHQRWNPACDMNGDNRIDIYDVAYVAHYFGWHNS
jgi:parallel beta-helix repeat protein